MFPKTKAVTAPAEVYVPRAAGSVLVRVHALAPGLAVTRCTQFSNDEDHGPECCAVTHLNTGRAVATCLRENTARKLMHALANLEDWAALTYDGAVRMKGDAARYAKVQALVAQAQREDTE